MKTIRVKVKEQIYDQFLESLEHFNKDEVVIIENRINSTDKSDFQKESTESSGYTLEGSQINQNSPGEFEETNNLREVRNLIKQLSSEELIRTRQWFYEFDHHLWDEKIEKDSKSGKLDSLVHEALEEYHRKEANDL